MKNSKKSQKTLNFSCFLPEFGNDIPEFIERQMSGKKWVNYGKDNKLPFYLYDCYEKSALMNSIINTTVDFVLGNQVKSPLEVVNSKGETMEEFLKDITLDYMIYRGFAFQIIYNKLGNVNELYWLDLRKCRVDEEQKILYYSKEFDVKSNPQYIEYTIWDPNDDSRKGSKVYYYNGSSRSVYPVPKYSGSLAAIQTNIEIQKFHLNAIKNNFSGNFLINFNNGVPADDVQHAIEKEIKNKFAGAENAGKFMVSFNESKENAADVVRIPEDLFDTKYDALNKSTTQAIFTGFSAPLQLFGGMVEGSVFNKQEYQEAFDLYNRLQVQPIQMLLKRVMKQVYNNDEILDFVPFALDADENKDEQKLNPVNNEQ